MGVGLRNRGNDGLQIARPASLLEMSGTSAPPLQSSQLILGCGWPKTRAEGIAAAKLRPIVLAAPFMVRPPVSEAPAVWVPDPVGREIGHTPEPATRLRALSAWALDLWRELTSFLRKCQPCHIGTCIKSRADALANLPEGGLPKGDAATESQPS